jgi:hypothetical protein
MVKIYLLNIFFTNIKILFFLNDQHIYAIKHRFLTNIQLSRHILPTRHH